jgi:DNA-binding response OmpR family regulator
VDGLDVLEQIKGHPQIKPVPVVVLTSSRQERDMVQSYCLGANSYIQKPMDFDEFQSTMKLVGDYWLKQNQPPPSLSYKGLPSR